jgi:hypothetical protein
VSVGRIFASFHSLLVIDAFDRKYGALCCVFTDWSDRLIGWRIVLGVFCPSAVESSNYNAPLGRSPFESLGMTTAHPVWFIIFLTSPQPSKSNWRGRTVASQPYQGK